MEFGVLLMFSKDIIDFSNDVVKRFEFMFRPSKIEHAIAGEEDQAIIDTLTHLQLD
jgi:glutathione peroxidase-family protein